MCHAVRAPGSNVTVPPLACEGSSASNSISTRTSPVKFASGPGRTGREPARVMTIRLRFRGCRAEKSQSRERRREADHACAPSMTGITGVDGLAREAACTSPKWLFPATDGS